jgi:hypothetical protein
VPAQVPDEIGQDEPVGEPPHAVDALERVVIAAGDDRLQGKIGQGLEDGEVGRRPGPIGVA